MVKKTKIEEEIFEEVEVPEWPKVAEKCNTCGKALLLQVGPEPHMFQNTELGMTKASPTQCRVCYDAEHSEKP